MENLNSGPLPDPEALKAEYSDIWADMIEDLGDNPTWARIVNWLFFQLTLNSTE